MQIDLINRQTDVDLSDFLSIVPTIVDIVLRIEEYDGSFVSIQFLSDSTMRRYHFRFFQDGSSTDCMSFPIDLEEVELDSAHRHLGEIFVCPKIALQFVRKQKLPIIHVYQEISLYIIHGLFHLLGYDDISPKERKIMRKKEAEALALLEKENNPLKISSQ
ncbi:MAG: rRNA maturation RNase YbeY [Chlamydia sp.]